MKLRRCYSSFTRIDKNEYLRLERWNDNPTVYSIGINRPAARNALNEQMVNELNSCFTHLSTAIGADAPRVVIIRSLVDGVFCAGADLFERKKMNESQVDSFVTKLRNAFLQVAECPVPTIALLQGVALGGGLELALACDLLFAGNKYACHSHPEQGTRVGLPETTLAIIPGAGGTQRLARIIGEKRAKEMIFTGNVISTSQMESYGLANSVLDKGTGLTKVLNVASLIAKKGPLAIKSAKIAIHQGLDTDLKNGLEIERKMYQLIIPTKDRIEGLDAFIEKRVPTYKGE